MGFDITRLHLKIDPLREVATFLIFTLKFPDRCNVPVNQSVGTGLGLLDIGVDPARDNVLNSDKILM